MRKSTRIVKKYIAAFLIVLMSIENFAAVVGDNDGAAFITKAEFDSLKNNFQAQIDQYNTSIDSKIDGAIASYLAGVQVSKQLKVKSLLDEKGKYGSLITKWSSATNAVFDNQSEKKCEFEWNYVISEWDHMLDTATVVKEAFNASARNKNAYNLGNDGIYKTSKIATFSDIDKSGKTIEIPCYARTAVGVKLYFTTLEYHSRILYANVEDWGPWGLSNNMANPENNALMKQGATNVAIQTGSYGDQLSARGVRQPDYFNFAVLSVTTNEYQSSVGDHLVAPLSGGSEFFWNQEDHDSYVRLVENTSYRYSYPTEFTRQLPAPVNGSYNGWTLNESRAFNTIRPRIPGWIYAPWLEHHTTHNEMILYDWKTVHKNNQKIKNGLILCEMEQDGKLTVECNSDFVGKVYFYPNKTPTDTWTESKVQTLDLTSANTKTKKEFDVEKGDFIWMRYLPTDTSKEAILKIDNIYLEVS